MCNIMLALYFFAFFGSVSSQSFTYTQDVTGNSTIVLSPGTWTSDSVATFTSSTGATARYNFTGTQIFVIGAQEGTVSQGSSSTFQVDGKPEVHVNSRDILGRTDTLYMSPELPYGLHELLITNNADTILALTQFNVTTTTMPVSSTTSPVLSTPTPVLPTRATTNKGISTPAIIGLVLGLVFGLGILAVALVLYFRMRKQRVPSDLETVQSIHSSTIHPFPVHEILQQHFATVTSSTSSVSWRNEKDPPAYEQ